MNRHIDKILIEYNTEQDALNDNNIANHIKECKRCESIFHNYFFNLKLLRDTVNQPQISNEECNEIFQNIIQKTRQTDQKLSFRLRIIAVAASIIIILATGIFYFSQKDKDYIENRADNNIISLLKPNKNIDLEIISELELFSNLDIIENLDLLEELGEIDDDEI